MEVKHKEKRPNYCTHRIQAHCFRQILLTFYAVSYLVICIYFKKAYGNKTEGMSVNYRAINGMVDINKSATKSVLWKNSIHMILYVRKIG